MSEFDPFSTPSEGFPSIAEPELEERKRPRFEMRWYVILHDDQLHTYRYVIEMLSKIFKISVGVAFAHAVEVDKEGYTIVARLPKEEAARKRDQIMSFGGDPWMQTDVSMKASIEPCDD